MWCADTHGHMYYLLNDYCMQRVVFEVPTVYQVGMGQLLAG